MKSFSVDRLKASESLRPVVEMLYRVVEFNYRSRAYESCTRDLVDDVLRLLIIGIQEVTAEEHRIWLSESYLAELLTINRLTIRRVGLTYLKQRPVLTQSEYHQTNLEKAIRTLAKQVYYSIVARAVDEGVAFPLNLPNLKQLGTSYAIIDGNQFAIKEFRQLLNTTLIFAVANNNGGVVSGAAKLVGICRSTTEKYVASNNAV